jgi:hypothetical protein
MVFTKWGATGGGIGRDTSHRPSPSSVSVVPTAASHIAAYDIPFSVARTGTSQNEPNSSRQSSALTCPLYTSGKGDMLSVRVEEGNIFILCATRGVMRVT